MALLQKTGLYILNDMHKHYHRSLIHLLLLALTVLPVTFVHAQTEQSLPQISSEHCQHMQSQADGETLAMNCCADMSMVCDQACGDCVHFGGVSMLAEVPVLVTVNKVNVFTAVPQLALLGAATSPQLPPPRTDI